MVITSTIGNSEGGFTTKFDSSPTYSRAWGSLTIGFGWSSTSFPFISFSFKYKPKWISLSHAKSTNLVMLFFESTISSPANYTYSLIRMSSLPRFKEEMRLANSFVVSFILDFSRLGEVTIGILETSQDKKIWSI